MNKTESAPLQLTELAVIEGDYQLRCLRYSPCEQYVYAGTQLGEILRWDVSGQEPQALDSLQGHSAWVEAIEFNDTSLFSIDSWGMLAAWPYHSEATDSEAADKKAPKARWQHKAAHDGWIRSLAISADGKRLATAGIDRTVRVWNADNGKLLAELQGHEQEFFAVALDAEGQQVAAVDQLANLLVWNVSSGEIVSEKQIEPMYYYDRDRDVAAITRLAFAEGDQSLHCAGGKPGNVQRVRGMPFMLELDSQSLEVKAEHSLGGDNDGYLYDFSWHADGYLMYLISSAPGKGQLTIRRLEEEQPIYESKMFNPHCIAYARGKNQLAISATNKRSAGNGAVRNDEGEYVGNTSPIHLFAIETGK